jgi:hypothetical protein
MAGTRTVRDLIQRSLRVATIIGAGDPMDPNDAADGLLSLNMMLDAWQAERLFCYALTEQTFAMPAGTSSVTIGPAGNINVSVRPPRIEYAFTRDATNVDRSIDIVPAEVWAGITIKNLGNAYPSALYYVPSYPLGVANLWQLPVAGLTLRLGLWTILTEYADLDVVVSLPPGYEDALVFSLAERACPEYGRSIPKDLAMLANRARANIQQNNLSDERVACEFTGVDNHRGLVPAWVVAAGGF